MLDLWETFNDIAEGFGLTVIEFREILQCSVKEYLGINEKSLAEVADAVFRTFDDDQVKRDRVLDGNIWRILMHFVCNVTDSGL